MSDEMGVGLNWITRYVDQDRIIWHNGGTGGFRTFIGFDPDRQVGAVVLTNSGHGADDLGFHLVNPELPLAPAPPPVEARVEVDVPERVLEPYVGEYRLAPELSIAVTLEGGSLFIQPTGQGKAEIFPESETDFFLKVVDAQIVFTRDESGAVSGLVLYQNGQEIAGEKVR